MDQAAAAARTSIYAPAFPGPRVVGPCVPVPTQPNNVFAPAALQMSPLHHQLLFVSRFYGPSLLPLPSFLPFPSSPFPLPLVHPPVHVSVSAPLLCTMDSPPPLLHVLTAAPSQAATTTTTATTSKRGVAAAERGAAEAEATATTATTATTAGPAAAAAAAATAGPAVPPHNLRTNVPIPDVPKDDPTACHICGKTFFDTSNLRRHFRVHNNQRQFQCPICLFRFRDPSNLRRHREDHMERKLWHCAFCNVRFQCQRDIVAHMSSIHHNAIDCDECGKASVDQASFAAHKADHAEAQIRREAGRYVCEHCGKRFVDKSNFARHKKTHVGTREFPCLACGKMFQDISHRNIHERRHCPEMKKNLLALV